ncbi:MAG: AAA family ATPase [Acutalibacteraceae bacterium]|nr:AAA family ATPase [Acutalibacteraceae bacterium]
MSVVAIMGDSGSGKTTSFRNVDPKTTMYVDCDKKGLSWKGWKKSFNTENRNYIVTDFPKTALEALVAVNTMPDYKHIKLIVFDTINGLMVADEMRRSKEKGYDKWQDLASCIYNLIDYALTVRDDLTVVFIAHTQTEMDDSGYMFTHIKTSGRKLDKIVLESKMTTVLLAKCVNGKYVFETQSNRSTAKSPLGLFEDREIENDFTLVQKALADF